MHSIIGSGVSEDELAGEHRSKACATAWKKDTRVVKFKCRHFPFHTFAYCEIARTTVFTVERHLQHPDETDQPSFRDSLAGWPRLRSVSSDEAWARSQGDAVVEFRSSDSIERWRDSHTLRQGVLILIGGKVAYDVADDLARKGRYFRFRG